MLMIIRGLQESAEKGVGAYMQLCRPHGCEEVLHSVPDDVTPACNILVSILELSCAFTSDY